MLGHPTSVETRKKIGAKNGPAMRRNWKNPAYVIMQIQKRGVQPNITETKFGEIFKRYFPDFKYNGDGRLGVVLAGLVPDFVNTNGRKIVIEIFGEYYHGEKNKQLKWHQTELGRVMAYKSVGFNCLILWSKELRNEPELLAKIRSFLSAKAKPPARRSL
jgi:very-short-patch-repair endonuclease